jgi:hypothetical protein
MINKFFYKYQRKPRDQNKLIQKNLSLIVDFVAQKNKSRVVVAKIDVSSLKQYSI